MKLVTKHVLRPAPGALLLGASLACGPQQPGGSSASGSEESGPETDASTNGEVTAQTPTSTGSTSTSTGTGPSTTTDDPSTSSTTSTGEPVHGEWFGLWCTGFGFTRFCACGEDDVWLVTDGSLPYYEICPSLWLRVIGTVTKDMDYTYLSVETIVSGPCAIGSCEQPDALDKCGDFVTLCE